MIVPRLFRFGCVLLTAGLFMSIFLAVSVVRTPIDPKLVSGYAESRRLVDRNGSLLRETVNADGARMYPTPLADLSPHVIAAVLATEDTRFYQHAGVDSKGLLRAVVDSVFAMRVVSGASTITMQLGRLLFHHERSGPGKVAQIVSAFRLERNLSKQEILEQYLNRAPFSPGTYGVEAASRRLFGKPSQHLSVAESALLAGLLQAPSALNPLHNEDSALRRQRHVLDRMLATGRIDADTYERAGAQPLHFVDVPPAPVAMHFTDYVIAQTPHVVDVRTTLDLDLERRVEDLIDAHVRSLALGGLSNAAVVVLDNRDCSILAMAGSTDYWNPDSGSVNGALARRQPGSTLKPFTYALSFERLPKLTPATVLADIETTYPGSGGSLFRPQNYSQSFSGPVLLAEALGRSLNVPAVRVANRIGPSVLLERLQAIGFHSLDRPAGHYGVGLTLGNGEVTLLELAQGYAMFARGGMSCTAHGRRGVEDRAGPRVFSEQVSYLITHILSDEDLRRRAFGVSNSLMLGFPMAVKTGTSTNWRDSWAVGYTERHTVAVWTGDFAGRPMNQLSGAAGAGPLFHRVARQVVTLDPERVAPRLPPRPAGIEEIVVCPLSGMRAGKHCPHRRAVLVEEQSQQHGQQHGQEDTETCDWHRSVRLDRRNGLLASERCPSEFTTERVFEVLPAQFAEWEAGAGRVPVPQLTSPNCPQTGTIADAVIITEPRPGEVFLVEPGYDRSTQSLRLAVEVDPPVGEVTWIVTSGASTKRLTAAWPYASSWRLEPGRHRIEVLAGGRRSEPILFEVR